MHAFVAPKIIGGKDAPSPVGELGMVEMSQALELLDVQYEQVRTAFFSRLLNYITSSIPGIFLDSCVLLLDANLPMLCICESPFFQ